MSLSDEACTAILTALIMAVSRGYAEMGIWCCDYSSGQYRLIGAGDGRESAGAAMARIKACWQQGAADLNALPECDAGSGLTGGIALFVLAPDTVPDGDLRTCFPPAPGAVAECLMRGDGRGPQIRPFGSFASAQEQTRAFCAGAAQVIRQLDDRNRPLGTIVVLSDTERALWIRLNDTLRPYPQESLAKLFRKAAARYSDRTAIHFGDVTVSYRALLADAERIAGALLGSGVRHGDAVGIYGERSPQAIKAIIGTVLAGCIYVPLSPSWPQARTCHIVAAAKIAAIIDCDGTGCPAAGDTRIWALDAMTGGDDSFGGDDNRSADDCIHILFTSGSTGAPKGVMVRHRGVARLVFDRSLHPIEPGMAVMHAAPLSFDAATKEIWLPLLNGGTVSGFALQDMLGAEAFSAARRTQPVDIAFFTFALFDALRAQDPRVFGGIARLHVGGEVVQPAAVRALLEAGYTGSIINSYGPTEATVYALTHEISWDDVRADRIPIGRPVASSAAYILDGHGRVAGVGIEGELFLGGDGVALGYLGDAALTEERFVADPFSGRGRLYRTGDTARLRSDGLIEYCGRCDGQIKLRGHRIEPGEIEAVVGAVPGVDQVVVGVHEAVAGDRRLVAWVRPQQPGPGVPAGALEHYVRGVLPDYMVPSWFIVVDEFPRTAHGKLDTAALPPPEITVSAHKAVELSDPLPGILATLRAMLINPHLGAEDSFLAAGGDSLLAVKCAQQIGGLCGVSPPVSLFFENETARRVADYIRVAGWARGLAAPGDQSPAMTMRF